MTPVTAWKPVWPRIRLLAVGAPFLVGALLMNGCHRGYSDSAKRVERTSPYHSVSMPDSARYYYQTVWGIDDLVLRVAASGSLVRFSYRVTNVQRAGALGNKRNEPLLIDLRRNVALKVPVMEQVGPLWQTVGLENGKHYWMTFSNKGSPVRAGDRVSVVIGDFHADGLLVE